MVKVDKLLLASVLAGALCSPAIADPVTGDINNLGTLNIGGPSTTFSDIETAGAIRHAGDYWFFTMPVIPAGSTGSVSGAVLPVNLTISFDPNLSFDTKINGVELWRTQVTGGAAQLLSNGTPDYLYRATPSDRAGVLDFTFSPLMSATTYALKVDYEIASGKVGAYHGALTAVSAVPESGALAMAGLGLGMIGFLSRRRRQG
jgi:hypothetical protein